MAVVELRYVLVLRECDTGVGFNRFEKDLLLVLTNLASAVIIPESVSEALRAVE